MNLVGGTWGAVGDLVGEALGWSSIKCLQAQCAQLKELRRKWKPGVNVNLLNG